MISIDLDCTIPLEDQLCKAIRAAIAREEVVAGDALPSVRQLAADLGIHWNTVARAYRRLGDEGLVSVRRGRGVLVRGIAERREADPAKITESIREAITEAKLSGMGLEAFRELVANELNQWKAHVA